MTATRPTSSAFPKHVGRLLRRRPAGAIGAAMLFIVVCMALFADAVATHDPLAQDIPNRLRPPGNDFFFGTDTFGRDLFSRVIHGARLSLSIAALSVTLGTTIGTAFGLASAYTGGKVDLLIQRVVDVLLGFPSLVLAIVMVVALGTSSSTVVVAVAIGLAPQSARLARSRALGVKEEPYMLAARIIGASPARLVLRHLLPNSIGPVLAHASGYFGAALMTEAALSFLGLGVPPPDPSWGRMLHEGAQQYLEVAPWLTFFPGLALSFTVLGFALLTDAVRDALDPRLSVYRR